MSGHKTLLFVNGSESVEGDTRVLLNTLQVLDPARYRCVCLTVPGPACDEIRNLKGVEVHTAPLQPIRRAGASAPVVGASAALRSLAALVRVGRREGADLVYTYDRTRAAEIAYIGARLLRKPMLLHAHDPFHLGGHSLRQKVTFRADRVVAVSRFVARRYEEAGCPSRKLRVVLNGVDLTRARADARGALRQRLGISPTAPVVGLVGRLSPWKGHEELLRAAVILREALPNLRVVIQGHDTDHAKWTHGAGETSYRALLERVRAELGLEECVDILDFDPSVGEVYTAADVVAVPSYEEPFGLVIVEAMLAGRAVVACSAGGPQEIITDGETGVLVSPRSPEALAGELRLLLTEGERRNRIAEAGRRHAREHFSLARYGRDFEGVLSELL